MTEGEEGACEPLTLAQQRLVKEHLWLARSLAAEYAWLAPKTLDGDLAGPSVDGLLEAARGYDPERGAFSTYAYRFVVGAMLDAAKSKAPAFVQAARAGLESATELLAGPAEPAPSHAPEDVAENLDVIAAGMCVGAATLGWAGRTGTPTEHEERADRRLAAAFAGFSEMERTIVVHRYGLGESWKDVAEAAGTSVRTAKRWGPKLRAVLEQRLRARRAPGPSLRPLSGPGATLA
jgi:RNA polymerase sigma factor (sigma-70 family)